MNAQSEDAIRGRLVAIEFLLKFEIAQRLKQEPDPVLAVTAHKELTIAFLNVKAAMAPDTDAGVYKAAAAATNSLLSEVKELLTG
jgi:hypothetical protein